jgi:hypothetical protein
MPPDPRPPKRIKDPVLLRAIHQQGGVCALADDTCESQLSLHHIHKHPRDDLEANLVFLCGSGTTGHHGLIEGHDKRTKERFGAYLLLKRSDFLIYLGRKLGSDEALHEWLIRLGYLPPA